MKGKIIELSYDAIKNNATFIVKCDYDKDFFKLQDLWGIYKQGKIDIDFNPIEYKCNCANDNIDSLCYSYKALSNINQGEVCIPPIKSKDYWDKWFSMLRKVYEPKTKVIFNEPATILYKDGKKYVCKCDKEDKFSEELGLALCLLKSFGVSYSDFEKLLKGVKRQRKRDE